MTSEKLRVLIVDDSRIFRAGIEEALSGRSDIQIVGSVWSGEKALELARTSLPDFVTLDIEMPGMGGIATLIALRELAIEQRRSIGILLVSSHTRRGAAVTIKGLQDGAFDFITKPEGTDPRLNAAALREQLFAKIDAFRSRRIIISTIAPPKPVPISAERRSTRFRAVVIGSSTGGPAALNQILPVLTRLAPVPIFLVQHFPQGFTHYFAADLAHRYKIRIVEAEEGQIAAPGTTYVAPGGRHLVLNDMDGKIAMGFTDSPPENGCRPAADVLFRSAAVTCSGQILAVVLTGMGSDGAKGAAVLKRAGGHVIVQDEASSVVWGMPGSVVAARAADEVLPIDQIASVALGHLGIGG